MKKLKSKVFWTICIILSLFLLTVLFILNYQDYNRAKTSIEQNLFRMTAERNRVPAGNNDRFSSKPVIDENNLSINSEEKPLRFMDAIIYTVILNGENEIIDIISHTEDGTVKCGVRETAIKIIDNNTYSNAHIGNLYIEKYSYNYNSGNYLTLIDNTGVRDRLLTTLKISISIFSVAELLIVAISEVLSKWIIKPAKMSFEKQRQFIADASHELKTPLSVIMASAEALEENKNEQKWLDNIKTESDRMSKLITNLLDLATLENADNKKLYELVDLSKLAEMSILTLESLAYEKNIKLNYEIKDGIKFKCNAEEIKELLSILLDNAIKHSAKKGNIVVKLKTDKNNIILEVKNKGIPIPKDEEEKIFERFYRADKSRNRNENRYGLGLAIAKAITTNHGGKISASSKDGYTTFTVVFKNKEH